jgi:hypothetical protein
MGDHDLCTFLFSGGPRQLPWDGNSPLDEWITSKIPAGGEPRFFAETKSCEWYGSMGKLFELHGATLAELVGDFVKRWAFDMPSEFDLNKFRGRAEFEQRVAPQQLKGLADRYAEWLKKLSAGDVESVACDPLFETLRELVHINLRLKPFSEERCDALLREVEKHNVPADEVRKEFAMFRREMSARFWAEIDNYFLSSRSMVVPRWLVDVINGNERLWTLWSTDEKDPHMEAINAQRVQKANSILEEFESYRDFLAEEYGQCQWYPEAVCIKRAGEIISTRLLSAGEIKWQEENGGIHEIKRDKW